MITMWNELSTMYCTSSGNEMNSRICDTLRMAAGRAEGEKEFQKSKFIPCNRSIIKIKYKKLTQYQKWLGPAATFRW